MKIEFVSESDIRALNDKRVYIYGAGSLAHMVKAAIESHGVKNIHFCVDKEYISEGENLAIEDCIGDIANEDAILSTEVFTEAILPIICSTAEEALLTP